MKLTKKEWLDQYSAELSERDIALLSAAYDVLKTNTVHPENSPWGDHDVISPWTGDFAGIWNWDSAFHGMTVSRFDTELAENCINCFVKFQLDSGMLPDVIFVNGEVVDSFSKPPVMPWAVLTVYEASGNTEFLRENYARMVKNERFWTERRCHNGLFFYSAERDIESENFQGPRYESGWDDSPRWDDGIIDLYPIDLNCYMVLFYRSMSKMAKYLSLPHDLWDDKELALVALIEEKLFDPNGMTYADRNRFTGKFSKTLSPASFMPLFIGTASSERAAAMARIARDKKKFFPGMPTVTYDHPEYCTKYWRGQTWLNVAYFAAKGLLLSGHADVANEIKEYILQMVYSNLEYGFFENYDSIACVGGHNPTFSWSAAFVIEFILNW